jgi:hypothetical protein
MARPRVQWTATIFLALAAILAFSYLFDGIDFGSDGQGGHRCVSCAIAWCLCHCSGCCCMHRPLARGPAHDAEFSNLVAYHQGKGLTNAG